MFMPPKPSILPILPTLHPPAALHHLDTHLHTEGLSSENQSELIGQDPHPLPPDQTHHHRGLELGIEVELGNWMSQR